MRRNARLPVAPMQVCEVPDYFGLNTHPADETSP